jgi:hypothetical protein
MDTKQNGRCWFYAGIGVLALGCGGCLAVAAGAAGGAAVGAAYYYGKVCQTYPSSLDDSSAATKTALADLGMPILEEQREGGSAFIKTQTGDGDPVRIYLDPEASKFQADGPLTKVTVRVGAFGDHPSSNRLLDQIGAHLAPPAMVSTAQPGTITPALWTGAGPAPVKPIGTTAEPPLITPPPAPPGAFPPPTPPPPVAK